MVFSEGYKSRVVRRLTGPNAVALDVLAHDLGRHVTGGRLTRRDRPDAELGERRLVVLHRLTPFAATDELQVQGLGKAPFRPALCHRHRFEPCISHGGQGRGSGTAGPQPSSSRRTSVRGALVR